MTMKHGLSWQTASLLHLIGSEWERIVKIANTKLTRLVVMCRKVKVLSILTLTWTG